MGHAGQRRRGNSIGVLLHRGLQRGARWDWRGGQEKHPLAGRWGGLRRRNQIWTPPGPTRVKDPRVETCQRPRGQRAAHGTAPPPSAEAPRSATLNLLFHAPRHKPPSRASINKQALCCSLSAWSVIIANGWEKKKKKKSDTGSRGEELPKYGLNQMAFHFQWELINAHVPRGLWVYWSLRSSCFLHAALNSFLLSAQNRDICILRKSNGS